jgi:acetyl-CoA synthetase
MSKLEVNPTFGMESMQKETRMFPPPAAFAAEAHIASFDQYQEMYAESIDNPSKFWGEKAAELDWFRKWDRVLEWNLPDAKWFIGGKMNACYNCVDRQVKAGLGDKTAVVWEGEPILADGKPEVRKLTYKDLQRETSRFANVLKNLGVRKGDVVTIYMPMVPELAIAMLACARIGAPHSIIFGGFSASAIRDRVEDARSKIIITADGGWRRGKVVPLKDTVDEALTMTDLVKTVVVHRRAGNNITMTGGRDHDWTALMNDASDACPCEEMDSEDLLFLLYTSGTTGKPKGIMHTTGGYLVYTYLTSKYTFDLHEDDPGEMYWCTADIGWITGHSYIIYGILPNRVPTLMYEGAPNAPGNDRFWDIVQRHKVTKFYTAPTAIRTFMKWGDQHPKSKDLSSIKVLGTVGEPINPEAWMWYRNTIGGGKAPIVDTFWQTETGGHVITPLPGATTTTPGSCTRAFFGIDAAVVNRDGSEVPANEGGLLVIRKPWPAIIRGIYGDRDRFIKTYWSTVEGYYLAGDSARRDANGNFWIMGRIDDVINVSGHRLGTAEVESALVSHPSVAEAAVVGVPHEIKGTGIAAFVTLRGGKTPSPALKEELMHHVGHEIGAIAKPDQIRFTDMLPKTRSGKIMRRLLREVAAGNEVKGDTTTLEDLGVLAKLRADED